METNRPQTKGLAKAREFYRNRPAKLKEFKEKGKKVMGYYCAYVPQEILAAADMVPFRIIGSMSEPVIKSDKYLEPQFCGHVATSFELALKGAYNGLDGLVVPHTCDHVERIDRLWWHFIKPGYAFALEVPHWRHYPDNIEFFREELASLQRSLEKLTGTEITAAKLAEQVKLYNQLRALVKELYELRKSDPPLISGSEMTETLAASMNMPVTEAISLIQEVIQEVRERKNTIDKKVRVLIWGSCIDDPLLMQLIEEVGANVVMDDLCVGSRSYWHDVPATSDPLEGISQRYLEVPCPVVCYDWTGSHRGDLEIRYSRLIDYARDYKVDRVILFSLLKCDTHAFWLPSLRDYLKSHGFPVLIVEEEYVLASAASLKTRVQAWVESIS